MLCYLALSLSLSPLLSQFCVTVTIEHIPLRISYRIFDNSQRRPTLNVL